MRPFDFRAELKMPTNMVDLRAIKFRMQKAMGVRLRKLCLQSLGPSGTGRESDWPPLSESYKKKLIRRGDTNLVPTLFRSGRFAATIKTFRDGDKQVVEAGEGINYAAAHQSGNPRLPRRPFFPFSAGGEVTPYARAQIMDVANRELAAILNEK